MVLQQGSQKMETADNHLAVGEMRKGPQMQEASWYQQNHFADAVAKIKPNE